MAGQGKGDLDLYASVGVFVHEGFLPARTSAVLTAHALAAAGEPGVVGVDGGAEVARDVRSVDTLDLADEVSADLDRRFARLRPALEACFGLALGWTEPVTMLRYRQGDFYRAHRDRVTTLDAFYRSRRISAVLFVNDETRPPDEGGFTGGALRFHGLGRKGPLESMPLDFQPRAGTFIAFRSDVLHEVLPVTSGERVTAVTWYHGG